MSDKTNKNLKEAGLKATLPRIKILEILQRLQALKIISLLKRFIKS